MNNRGKPLSHLELLKNRLIFLSTKISADSMERSKLRQIINESWKSAYHYLGRCKGEFLEDDDFLKCHFRAHTLPQVKSEKLIQRLEAIRQVRIFEREGYFKEYLLDEVFTTQNIVNQSDAPLTHPISLQTLSQYAKSIKSSVAIYSNMRTPEISDFSENVKIHLSRLNRLGWQSFIPIAMLACEHTIEPNLELLLKEMERFVFISGFAAAFAGIYIDTQEVSILSLIDMSRNKEISKIVELLQDRTDLFAKQLSYIPATVPHTTRNFYGWKAIRYFLFEYEQYLFGQNKTRREKITWQTFISEDFKNDYLTVEHIYPQKPKHPSWKDEFKSYTSKQKSLLRNSLGNLVALSQAKNSTLGNRPFVDKKNGSEGCNGYRHGSYSEIEVAGYDVWNAKSILDRGLKMLHSRKSLGC